jgi:hypothetical protein
MKRVHQFIRKYKAMKITVIILTAIIISFLGCSKDDNSASPNFSITDLEGTWDGFAKNSTDSISLNLIVNSSGHASSSTASGEWSIGVKGKVTGPGAYLFPSGSLYVNANWSLQLSADKRKLTGTLDIDYSSLHNMDVTLTKE